MKKVFYLAVICLTLMTFVGCSGKKELKEMKGVVTYIWAEQDSLVSVNVANGSDTLLFHAEEARIVNGMFINGDSVNINYIEGEKDTLRAMVITVLPRPIHTIDLNSAEQSDTLLTRPLDTEAPIQPAE